MFTPRQGLAWYEDVVDGATSRFSTSDLPPARQARERHCGVQIKPWNQSWVEFGGCPMRQTSFSTMGSMRLLCTEYHLKTPHVCGTLLLSTRRTWHGRPHGREPGKRAPRRCEEKYKDFTRRNARRNLVRFSPLFISPSSFPHQPDKQPVRSV